MNPTPSDVHVNTVLTNISIAFFQETDDFVATKIFPVVPVQKQSDRYFVYNRGDFNRDEMQKRPPATESAGGGYKLDNTPSYYADVWAFHKDVDDQTRANSDSVLQPDADATEYVTLKALIRREMIFASNYFVNGIWTTTITGVPTAPTTTGLNRLQWNNAASTPIEDIRFAKTAVHITGGLKPNKLVLSRPVYDVLLDHPDFIDRVKYGQTPGKPAMANLQIMAQILELDEVVVMDGIVNQGPEYLSAITGPNDGENNSFIGGLGALLVYVPTRPGLQTPSAGYTFSWVGYLGAGADGQRIKNFRIEPIAANRVEIEMAMSMNLTAADLGCYFLNIIAQPTW